MSSIRCKFLEVISEKFGQTSEFKYNLSPSNGWSGRTYNSNTRGYAASLNIRFQGWDNHLPLTELAYKNSYHSNIQMTLYEALYGRKCWSPIGWFEPSETALFWPDLIHQGMEKVKVIQHRLQTAQSRHKSYTNVRRRGLGFSIGDWVSRPNPMGRD